MSKMREPKLFTLQDARETLPFVRKVVEDIVATQKQLDALEQDKKQNATYRELQQELKGFLKELLLVGCHLKNAKLGTVAYYWDYNNTVRELYWQIGDQDISYWKELGGARLNILDASMEKIEESTSQKLN